MSEAASLPGNLFDEPAAQPATRTRQDNWATLTVEGIFTEVHRRHLDRIDLIQPTMDFVKINAGSFTGKQSTINGRTTVSFAKFLHNFKSIVYRIAANCPVQIDAVTHTESIVNELRPREETPQFITVFNQLVFNILLNASDEEAMNIVLQYEHSDDSQQTLKKDGRRALFALMQTYAPVSTNASNLVKAKLPEPTSLSPTSFGHLSHRASKAQTGHLSDLHCQCRPSSRPRSLSGSSTRFANTYLP
jgi:hypothetical protein